MTSLSYDPLRLLVKAGIAEIFSVSAWRIALRFLIVLITVAIAGFVAFQSEQSGDTRPFLMVAAVFGIYAVFAWSVIFWKHFVAKEDDPLGNEDELKPLESPVEEPAGLAGILKWHDRLFAKISGSRIRLLAWRIVAIIGGWTALFAAGLLAFVMKDVAYFGWGALAVGLFAAFAHKVLEFRTSELAHLDKATAKRRVKMGRIANISIFLIFVVSMSVGVQSYMSLWLLLVPIVMFPLIQITPAVLHFFVTKPEA